MGLAVAAVLLAGLPVEAQNSAGKASPAPSDTAWKKLEFLLGKWTGVAGEKDTPVGAGQGAFSFELQLDRKIIVRHNYAEYSSAPRHDDLMVIYLDAPNDTPRAIYFDSEGHVIRYNLAFPSRDRVVFESDGTQAGPRYRLSYWLERESLNGKFEVATPGSEYRTYLSWKSKKN
jgi:hypothetical protein